MHLDELAHSWNLHAETDPMWAVLMDPERDMGRWDPLEFFATGQADVAGAMHSVYELGVSLPRRRALDFGCGLGRLSQGLACYFDEVDGVDIAPAMIRQARDLNPYGDRVRFHLNHRDDLALFADGQFDFVLSLIALQHIRPEYAKRYVAEFLRVLAPGGLLLFQQPSHRTSRPIDNDYATFGDRLSRWWRRLLKLRLHAPPVLDEAMRVARHERLTPVTHNFRPRFRVDGAHGAAQSPHDATPPVRHSNEVAATELHLIPRREMLAHLKRHGGRVVHVTHRIDVNSVHASYRYYVTK